MNCRPNTRSMCLTGLLVAAVSLLVVPALVALAASPATTVPPSGPTIPADQVAGRVGDVVLQDTTGHVLRDGDGNTVFLVHLPDGATCPGDSANDQWRWNSFLIPVDEDPMQMIYSSTGPEPPWTEGRYPLFENARQMPMAVQFLRRNPAPGSPALIGAIPQTSFLVIAQNQFPGGHYRLGVACSYFNHTTQFWDVQIDLTAAVDGHPESLTWSLPTVTSEQVAASKSSSSKSWVLLVVFGAAVLVLFLLWRHRVAGNLKKKES